MKSIFTLALAAALALVALGGGASAQNGTGSSAIGGVNNQSSNQAPSMNFWDRDSAFSPPVDYKAIADYRAQVKAYKMACAVDRQARCDGRHSAEAVWTCLRIRRSTLTEPCRNATFAVERAAADANLSD